MSEDILDRLRFCAGFHARTGYPENAKLFREAAEEIEHLRDRVKRWEPMADPDQWGSVSVTYPD